VPLTPDGRNRTVREAIIARALRRARPGSGSSQAFLRARTWEGHPDVTGDVARLSTPVAIVGGVATALYMPERATPGVDLLVPLPDAPALRAELETLGYARIGNLRIGGTAWRAPGGDQLGVIESDAPWVHEAVSRPERAPDGAPVVALPYLVLMKLDASRAQDVADISRMLGQAGPDTMDAVRELIRRYRPGDLEDLESLAAIGALELQEP
jgi:hypothetical protein